MDANLLETGGRILAEKGLAFTGVGPGAGNSSRLAREYFDSLAIEFRVVDAPAASTEITLFGHAFRTPVMTAALSALKMVHPEGMAGLADGAARAGALVWVGVGDADELRAVVATGAKTVKLIKPYRDKKTVLEKIALAKSCGAIALGMDVSYAYGMKNGYMPAAMGPQTRADLAEYVAAAEIPFVVKGVLGAVDAEKVLAAGAAGIVVSNQGGAILDYSLPPARALPAVLKAVGGAVPVFLDGAVADGVDVFKALALGADAVGVGYALAAALAAGGADGVKTVIDGMTRQLARTMSLTGAATLEAIDPTVLWRPER